MIKLLRTFVLSLCLLAVACPAWAVNNWTGSNAVAVYRFEDNADDSSPVGTNDLTEMNTPTHDDVDYQEGLESFEFDAGQSEYCVRTDADLSATFPAKTGVSPQDFSILAFFRCPLWGSGGTWRGIASKYDATGNKRCFTLSVASTDDRLHLLIGYNDGASYNDLEFPTVLSENTWYHVGATFTLGSDPTNHVLKIRLFYWTGAAWAQVNASNETTTLSFAQTPNSENAPFEVGRFNISSVGEMHGELDEVVVFAGEALSDGDIDKIRAGTYGAAPGGVLRPFWFFQ